MKMNTIATTQNQRLPTSAEIRRCAPVPSSSRSCLASADVFAGGRGSVLLVSASAMAGLTLGATPCPVKPRRQASPAEAASAVRSLDPSHRVVEHHVDDDPRDTHIRPDRQREPGDPPVLGEAT